MRIVVTGTLGYLGAGVVAHLRERFAEAELVGFDSGLFADCLTTAGAAPETLLSAQHFGDLRDADFALLRGADAVVHLAAVCDDPAGARFEAATEAINRAASLRLASIAAAAGARAFVFASSCAVYGDSGEAARRERDAPDPRDAGARAKLAVEDGLRTMERAGMTITSLRLATACGMSERLRLDLIANELVAGAVASGRIEVPGEAGAWRTLIDVGDIARAVEWAMLRGAQAGGEVLTVNVGREENNVRLRELAAAVVHALPGTLPAQGNAVPGALSCRVNFDLFRTLAPEHQPRVELLVSIGRLVRGLRGIGFADKEFRRGDRMIRRNRLSTLLRDGALTEELRWRRAAHRAAA